VLRADGGVWSDRLRKREVIAVGSKGKRYSPRFQFQVERGPVRAHDQPTCYLSPAKKNTKIERLKSDGSALER